MKLVHKNLYEEVKSAYVAEQNGKIKQRLHIILKAFKIKSSYKIAEQVNTSHTKVQRWIKRFNKKGIYGLKDKPRSGSPAKLNRNQLRELDEEISRDKEFSVGWRTLEVKQFISKNYHVNYTPFHIRRLLRKMDYSRVIPRPSHVNKKPIEAQETARQIKKKFLVWVKNGQSLPKTNSV
jgi:transposase